MSKYIPFPAYYDNAPVDLSHVFADERPAGRHGFLKADGESFVFEDGSPGRFWGTNFNGGACFPSHDDSEKIARRLAMFGCNIVRFHQLDAEWNTPNIFRFTKGKHCSVTSELDTESMDRLDYFISCLKEQGIYIYLDLLTYRRFKTEDGVERAPELGDAAKPYSCYNRRMIELQKQFAYDLWNHYNPYTKLKYKDDAAFALCEVVNESDLFSRTLSLEPYVSEFRALFRSWLDENNIEFDAENCDLNARVTEINDFKIALSEQYYIEMIEFMREIGVKIPITGTNWTQCDEVVKSQLVTDFTDSHTYFYDWKWGQHSCMNRAITQVPDCGIANLSIMRVYDKPFFVSEWDMPWPNEYRAESPIFYAAVGSMQNWAGFTIHTYAYTNRLDRMDILGKEINSPSIGAIAYREGIFSTWNDPAKFGLFYHSSLITRRADISSDGKKTAVEAGTNKRVAYAAASEKCRIAASFDGGKHADRLVSAEETIVDIDSGEVRSDSGQLYRNWKDNYGIIDTPRTKCVYGFLAKNGRQELDGFAADCRVDFAVIAASSLTDQPLDKTDSILLSTVGRAKNTDAVFEGEKMLEFGKAPILAEVIEADIEFVTERSNMVVWAVGPESIYIGRVPAVYQDGKLKFTVGVQFPSIYYIIEAE